jgi:hypothetical protein
MCFTFSLPGNLVFIVALPLASRLIRQQTVRRTATLAHGSARENRESTIRGHRKKVSLRGVSRYDRASGP